MTAKAEISVTSRAPQQERGQRRVEQILDAAEAVFAEKGVEAASMQLIADRAESSVGSLYHFFPKKESIVEALGWRCLERVVERNEKAMPLELAHLPAEQLFKRVFDAQMQFIEETPSFNTVTEAIRKHFPEISKQLNEALVGHVAKFLALRYPRMSPAEAQTSALTAVVMVHAIVDVVAKLPPKTRPAVLNEAKTVLVAYYDRYDAQR